jgi:membrane dipeptidase
VDNNRADTLHREAIVIDIHNDILMPIADAKMRLGDRVELPDPASWEPPLGLIPTGLANLGNYPPHTAYFQTMGLYDLPHLLEGGVTLEGYAIYIENGQLDHALKRGLEMVYCLHREAAENASFDLVTTVDDIHRVKREGKTGGFLALEGFEPLACDLRMLDLYYELGLRMASLTHSRRNCFADGTHRNGGAYGGLTNLGQQAVKRMNDLGIVIDVVHLALPGIWELLAMTEAPVVLSHTSPTRGFYPDYHGEATTRQLLEAIAANDGVVAIIAYNQQSLDTYVDDIEYVIKAVGPDHVGLGTDFFGIERAPTGFVGMQDTPNVTRRLVERGHSDEVIRKILGGNFLRVFRAVWGG